MFSILARRLATAFILFSGFAASATLINGAGASFPYPLYAKWFSEYQKKNPDVQINYQSIGSGAGIQQFTGKTIDFGASDAPMTDEQLAKAGAPVVHVPTVLGAVVLTYNLPGVETGLKLTGSIVADIFLGKVTKWNDAAITKLNAGVKLPDMPILVAHRSDGSGTTNIFADYLSKVSEDWKSKVGVGTSLKWPVGLGGKGNEGVSGLVKQTPGSVGYVEWIYAENNKLPYASLQNKSGAFVAPTQASIASAADGALKTMPEDFRVSITDANGKGSYPIAGFTYLLLWKTMPDLDKAGKLVGFVHWALKDGQQFASSLFYAPLPKSLVAKIEKKVATIETKKMNR